MAWYLRKKNTMISHVQHTTKKVRYIKTGLFTCCIYYNHVCLTCTRRKKCPFDILRTNNLEIDYNHYYFQHWLGTVIKNTENTTLTLNCIFEFRPNGYCEFWCAIHAFQRQMYHEYIPNIEKRQFLLLKHILKKLYKRSGPLL